jgi:transposase
MESKPPIAERLWKLLPSAVRNAVQRLVQSFSRKVDRLSQTIVEQERLINRLQQENDRLQQKVGQLEKQRQALQERVGKNSTNSSQPPSSDGPHVKRAPPKKRSGRQRGAQRGHTKHERPLIPSDECREVIPVKPVACSRCGERLSGSDAAPKRHQVWELPPLSPEVTEYQLHTLECPCCGKATPAKLPEGVPRGQFGPRLTSLAALLTGVYRLSKRSVRQILQDLWGVPISLGQICRLQDQTRKTLDPVVDEARASVRTQPANVDETHWREGGRRCWLWTAVTASVVVYSIRARRSSQVLWEILGKSYERVATSDRAKAYEVLPLRQRQVCWAHLRRDFQAMIDRGGPGEAVGRELLFLADVMLGAWAQVREGRRRRAWFLKLLEDCRPDVRLELDRGAGCGCAKTAATCRELLAHEEALWTFATEEGVEPTNNTAERAQIHAVQYRKTSYGTDSAGGSRFLENLFSVAGSCRLQGRNIWHYLIACHEAHLAGQPPPSLLPQQAAS